MDHCLHGAGVKIVLDEPLSVASGEKPLKAHAFFGVSGVAPEELSVSLREGKLEAFLPSQPLNTRFATEAAAYSTYGRLVAAEVDHRTGALLALADAFVGHAPAGPSNAAGLPAIYTYFGQFIAHEVSHLSRSAESDPSIQNPVAGFINLNTASFDLDTVLFAASRYPVEIQKTAPLCRKFGLAALGNTAPGTTPDLSDLPRSTIGAPVVPDSRNDANLQLAQLHVAILKKYLALRETSPDPETDLRRLLHAITIHDYLPQVVDACIYDDVLQSGRRLVHVDPGPQDPFLTPIEFAVGAQRFGHAMVRSAYRWSRAAPAPDAALQNLMRRTFVGAGLAFDTGASPNDEIRRLDANWTMEPCDMLPCPGVQEPNLANRIGPALSPPLQQLSGLHVQDADPLSTVNLAEKTLLRGQEVMLPCAQSLWAAIEPVCGRFLTEAEIAGPAGSPFHDVLTMDNPEGPPLVAQTPLWFYVLRESEVLQAGAKLGPLGGRIVMETIHAAIEAAGSDPLNLDPATLADLFT